MTSPRFSRVLLAEGASNFGSMLSRLAIPWLAALVLNASPLQMAALLMADVAAGALGALWLGPWVDRHGKRAVMLAADGARAVLLAGLALAAWQQVVSMALLVAAAAASGMLTLAFELARSAWMAQQLPTAELPGSNAQLSVTGSVSETLAFAVGGWLYQGLGAVGALLVDALSYAASALCLRGVGEVPPVRESPPPVASESEPARSDWRVLTQHPALRTLAGIEAFKALGLALAGTSYMIFVSRDLALPTGELGLVFALGGLGAVLGASAAPRLGQHLGPGWAMTLGLGLAALGAACVPQAQGAGWAAIAWLVAHQIVGDAGHSLHDVHDRTLRQTAVPAQLLARADAGLRGIGQGGHAGRCGGGGRDGQCRGHARRAVGSGAQRGSGSGAGGVAAGGASVAAALKLKIRCIAVHFSPGGVHGVVACSVPISDSQRSSTGSVASAWRRRSMLNTASSVSISITSRVPRRWISMVSTPWRCRCASTSGQTARWCAS